MKRGLLSFVLPAVVFVLASARGEDAPIETKFWKDIPEQAAVLSATFVGGKGNEWLVSGGFKPDGTVVLAGNVIGPVFELSVPIKVIGTDIPPPAEPVRIQKKKKDLPETDSKGRPVYEKPSWTHAGTTGFVVLLSPDAKTIISAARFPWASGAVTSAAVASDGAIFISGRATDGIQTLGPAQELPAVSDVSRKDGRCNHVFLAKLTPDGMKAEWVRHVRGFSDAPKVTLLTNGNISLAAQDLKTFDPKGAVVAALPVPGGMNERSSVNPIDSSIVKGGEHHWPTGREPWRCPTLNIHAPDGALKYQLYDWGGPYVGLENCRQVSDSAVRAVTHDKDGNILLYAWSDGGNSVMTTEATDVRQPVSPHGLGITAAGAGVLSCAYLIKLEPKNYTATGWTMWLAFRGVNKPNSVWIDALGYADDGSVIFAGRSAIGLWQTKNRISEGPPAGDYIAVLTPDMGGVRFCSTIPGACATVIGNDERQGWGVATGTVQNKARALFLCGAVDSDEQYGVTSNTPVRNAAQEKFGGGWCDGYVVIVDLAAGAPGTAASSSATIDVAPKPSRASFEASARAKGGKNNASLPLENTSFAFQPNVPKHVTVDAEIRDRAGKLWPSFLSGKPVKGSFVYSNQGSTGTIEVACTAICQNRGDQTRRVLGELVKDEKPPEFAFAIESIGPTKTQDLAFTDSRGKTQNRTVEYAEAKGVLTIAGKKVNVSPRLTFNYQSGKNGVEAVRIDAWLTLKGPDIGLSAAGAGELDLRIGMIGTAQSAKPSK